MNESSIYRLIRQIAAQVEEKELAKLLCKPSFQNLPDIMGPVTMDSLPRGGGSKKFEDSVEIPKKDLCECRQSSPLLSKFLVSWDKYVRGANVIALRRRQRWRRLCEKNF